MRVWGCTASGVGDLIEGITNADKYKQILIHHATPSGKRLIRSEERRVGKEGHRLRSSRCSLYHMNKYYASPS